MSEMLEHGRVRRDSVERLAVPAGPFLFGLACEMRELPAFLVGATPVTNDQYAAFVAATGRAAPKHWDGRIPPTGIEDHPVGFVSWFDACAFAEWVGGRLLSELEWERAARGVDGRRFPWGEWTEGRCNSKEAGIGGTTPVGRFSLSGDSPCGCVDMAGNAQEWTASDSGKYKVIRGGAFNHDRTLAQTFYAVRHAPSFSSRNIGFRVGWDA